MSKVEMPPAPVGQAPEAPKKKHTKRNVLIGVAVAIVLMAAAGSSGSGSETPAAKADAPKVEAPTADAPAQTQTQAPAEPEFTVSQENAIESAKSYLNFSAFSELGLIDQLSSKYGEGFSKADAVFAVNHIEVDWNEQAAKSAKDYLDTSSFSCQGLIDQLESQYGERFTHSQAVYGAQQTGLCS
jgi:hypothetical protein